MDDFGPDDLQGYEASDILQARSDADWASDRELVDQHLRDPWSSEDQ